MLVVRFLLQKSTACWLCSLQLWGFSAAAPSGRNMKKQHQGTPWLFVHHDSNFSGAQALSITRYALEGPGQGGKMHSVRISVTHFSSSKFTHIMLHGRRKFHGRWYHIMNHRRRNLFVNFTYSSWMKPHIYIKVNDSKCILHTCYTIRCSLEDVLGLALFFFIQ